MKTYAIMITLFWGLTSIAQSDTISDCAKYKSLYYQYLKQGMYTDAAFFWDQAYEACLAANELDYKIYKNGKVLNYQLRSSLSPSDSIRYQALTDSIVWIYDEGLDVVREQQWKYEYASFLISNQKKTKILLIDSLLKDMQVSEDLPSSRVIENYFKWQLITNENPFKDPLRGYEILQNYIDYSVLCFKTFEDTSIAMNYENADMRMRMYLKMITVQSEKSLDQITKLNAKASSNKVVRNKELERNLELMEICDLTETKLYQEMRLELLELNPSAKGYYDFGRALFNLKRYEDAVSQFELAMSLDGDSLYLDNSRYQIALASYMRGDFSRAFKTAKKVNGENIGKAYVLMGDCVVSKSKNCGESTFERKANYWLAYDLYQKALNSGEKVNPQQYLNAAPSTNEIFEEGLNKGDTYWLKCWGEQTVVR
ncbi:MAG: tetratricopeptide repeat protein [Crocinitomicaceae bacterium]